MIEQVTAYKPNFPASLSPLECTHIFKENLVEQMQKQTLSDSWHDFLKIPYVGLLPKSLT